FRNMMDGLTRDEFTGHSIECIIDPLQFDPQLAHFCTACKPASPSISYLRRSLLLSPFPLFFRANPKASTAWLSALWPNDKVANQSEYYQTIMKKEGWRFAFAMGIWD